MIPTYLWITCMVIVIYFLQSTDGGVNVSLSSSSADNKTKEPHKISIGCSLEGNTTVITLHSIKILQIQRKCERENKFVVIAQTQSDKSPEVPSSAPLDIIDRKISTGITLYKPASSKIKLEFNTAVMVCEGVGEYKCTAVFDDAHDILVIEDATDALENHICPIVSNCTGRGSTCAVVAATLCKSGLNIGRDAFQCYFKCFGGTAAMGIGGVMALIALMPAIWFD